MIQGRIPEIDKHPKNKRNKSQSISGRSYLITGLMGITFVHDRAALVIYFENVQRKSRYKFCAMKYHNFLLYNFFLYVAQ